MDPYAVIGVNPGSSLQEKDSELEKWATQSEQYGKDEELYGQLIRAGHQQAQTIPLQQISLDFPLTLYTTPGFFDEVKPGRVISRREIKKSKKCWVTVQTTKMSDGRVATEIARNTFVPPRGSAFIGDKPEDSNGYRKYARRLLKPVKKEFNMLVRDDPELSEDWNEDTEEEENENASGHPALERNYNSLRSLDKLQRPEYSWFERGFVLNDEDLEAWRAFNEINLWCTSEAHL